MSVVGVRGVESVRADGDESRQSGVDADDSWSEGTAALTQPWFEVEITGTNTPVAGEDLEVTVAVTNTGDWEDTQTIEVDADGLGWDSATLTLDAGESATESFWIETEEDDDGEYTVTAASDDDTDTETVVVSDPAGGGGFFSQELLVLGGVGGVLALLGTYTLLWRSRGDDDSTPREPTSEVSATGAGDTADDGSSTATDTILSGEELAAAPSAEPSAATPDEDISGVSSDEDISGVSSDEDISGVSSDEEPSAATPDEGSATGTSGDEPSSSSAEGSPTTPDDEPPTPSDGEPPAVSGDESSILPEGGSLAASGSEPSAASDSEPSATSDSEPSAASGDEPPAVEGDTGKDVVEAETRLRDAPSAGRIPTAIPTAPALSLAYEDITKEGRIGSGGQADVYRATVPTDDGELTVALKEPRIDDMRHADTLERLVMEEAEVWHKLDDHDHIVSIVDYGDEPRPWIAMEYMDAGHVDNRGGEMEFEQSLWTALATTRAVRHAHRRGVAHLDLKPQNILFQSVEGAWDVPKVADWGLSKQLLEYSKSVAGMSPHYAAPEQFDGEYGTADDITDVYQLGAVFYVLFTGELPFEGRPVQVMNKVLNEQPTPPSEVADVPPELDDVILTAMSIDKEDRYESVLYLRDELRTLRSQW